MSLDIVLLVGCASVALALWWLVVWLVTRRGAGTVAGRPARLALRWPRRRGRGSGRHRAAPVAPDPVPPVSEVHLTLGWADPAQVWPALNAENALLAARMSGQITPVEYRARLADLARRCEPHSAADSE
ncbi:hypothetical protein IU500_15390 [Nocardia terpenica]|uniref:Uncharacterized protein n=1 Tax=Nocardia terpenica TaxID=455432 RepID=A0A164LUL4_9NOCA|nr:hypothetical protein [Nocardia terpenica]KZM72759.1 hypothetical protein AWN90_28725 [Nocardia terpenica]MBF6061343.1 hypothetical protein [Nocardia terpenica]MBF6105428.1 hypothetical protein [Nocardia terpenica]MBF6113102.1 hypothetical protein [Nocardia terpenica]MBF6119232.1 hypothetical protein [Nocardia terpenica]